MLAAVVLFELTLFAGYHRDRWTQAIGPLSPTGEGLVVRCDGLGYYAWLRSLLIDGDWSFDNEFDHHNVARDYVPPADVRTACGRRPNPWSVGPACVWAVAVVPGHLALSALQGLGVPWPADGYSLPYQLLVGGVSLLACGVGLGCLYRACRCFARPERAALVACFLTLGTTIIYYSAVEVSMAHGIATAVTAGLVAYWLSTYGSPAWHRWGLVGLLVGTAALMRWQLATFALLPAGEFVLAGWASRRLLPWRGAARLLLAAVAAAVAFLPQAVAWHQVYGAWLVTPYPTAHNWGSPSWGQVLWSEDRGLFYWTPLVLLAAGAAGLSAWHGLRLGRRTYFRGCREAAEHEASGRRDSRPPHSLPPGVPKAALALLVLAFAVHVYLVAALSGAQAYLGVAFGPRHLTEAAVALAPGFAMFLERASPRQFRLTCAVAGLLVVWNLVLVSQYRYGYLPADAGADPATLLANAMRLIRRKRLLLVGEVLLGPALMWAAAAWPARGWRALVGGSSVAGFRYNSSRR